MNQTIAIMACAVFPLTAQGAWVIDSQLDQLFTLDLATGTPTLVGSTLNNGLDAPADLCWRDDTNEIYAVDLAGGEVGYFSTGTATFIVRWNTTISGFQALAWDAEERRFWLHNQANTLYSLDPTNGALTLIGGISGSPIITSLEVDAQGRLWALDSATGGVFEMNKTTGAATRRATTSTGMQGLAIDAVGNWFAVNAATDTLYRIDPVTGTATAVGPTAGVPLAKGLAIAGTAAQRGGTACADGAGSTRRLTWTGSSALGGTLQLGVDAGASPMFALMMFGFSARQAGPLTLPAELTQFGAPGCRLYTGPDAMAGPIQTGTTLPVPMPSAPATVGMVVFTQATILDSSPGANAAGLAFSDLLRMIVVP
ncbi:MAG: hypothetical protein IPK26_00530 [Planctomycetes bacterium]|nr:hypothetical protein [Planctomycetota bacterium]